MHTSRRFQVGSVILVRLHVVAAATAAESSFAHRHLKVLLARFLASQHKSSPSPLAKKAQQ